MSLPLLRRLAPFAALTAIFAATLYPSPSTDPSPWARCILCGEHGAADFLVNLILFAPLGASLAWRGWQWRGVLAAGALVSGLVESAQLVIPGRDPSLGDILTNTLGALAAALAVRHAAAWLRPAHPGRWAVGGAAVAAIVLLGSGALLRPALPASVYYGQWTPNLGHLFWYRGRVLAATLGDQPLPPRRLADSDSMRRLLLAGARLEARFVAGPRPPRLAPIVSVYDDGQREIALLGVDRDDVVWRIRLRATDRGLDQPDVRFRGAVRSVARGDTLALAVWRQGPAYCLEMNGDTRCGPRVSPARAWALFMYPESLPPWVCGLLDGAWLAGLVFPVGLWAAGAPRALSVAAVMVVVFPAWPALADVGPAGWGAALAGLVAGGAAWRLLERRWPRG